MDVDALHEAAGNGEGEGTDSGEEVRAGPVEPNSWS
jgi:hypothetical protein